MTDREFGKDKLKSGSDIKPFRRTFLRAVAGGSTIGSVSGLAIAGHETDDCSVTIDFRETRVATITGIQSAGITELTVFYFDRNRDAHKQSGITPDSNDEYGPLRIRYSKGRDMTIVQIGGQNASIRRVVAFGPDCRTAATNPLGDAAGENKEPTADFQWNPESPTVGETTTFTSTAEDPDGTLIHYGWDFDGDGKEDATGEEVTHVFPTAGDQEVTHKVIDDFDATDSITRTVTVRKKQCWEQVAKLSADDGDEDDFFGKSVAVIGDVALVGASGEGATYEFTRSDGGWSQQQKLVGDDPNDFDRFGWSVAMTEDTAVIGADGDDNSNGRAAGAVYVFTRSDGTWSQQQKLLADDGEEFDRFGWSVAIDEDTVVVGVRSDDNSNGDSAGSAYVFTRSNGTWSQQQKLLADDGDRVDRFGDSVALAGNTMVVGASKDEDSSGAETGSAYVFTRSNGTWSQQQKLLADDGDDRDFFGRSVVVEEDSTLIGARGALYVFTRSNGTWSQQQKLTPDNDGDLNSFGQAVAKDGDTTVVGAQREDDPNAPSDTGTDAGAAYVFTRSDGTWSQLQKLVADDRDGRDLFGGSVSVDGDTSVIGALSDEDPNGDDAGSAYVFEC